MKLLEGFNIKSSLIRDPIYTYIELPDKLKPIVDHKLFQRLRNITQVPLLDMVYPSAKHTRFEHSLGTMYLFMFTIISLYSNSKREFLELMNNDNILKKVSGEEEQIRQLILAAGAIGLLHDIGHGPFSHALEDAIKNYKFIMKNSHYPEYDHEQVAIQLIQNIIADPSLQDAGYFLDFTYSVLNKNIQTNSNLKKIMRSLIDSKIIDVDKGDYLLRDAYHSGTSYGKYEFLRLWSNLELFNLNNEFRIVVKEKSAIEVFNLHLARFNMYFNVYKHHIRLITDAIISNIIFMALKNKIRVVPYKENFEVDINEFLHWTDDTLLFQLSKNEKIDKEIKSFLSRNLFKRSGNTNICEFKNSEEIRNYLTTGTNFLTEYKINYSDILVHIFKKPILPILTESIQNHEIVLTKNKEVLSVAEYFNFSSKEFSSKNHKYECHIFIKPNKIPEIGKDTFFQKLQQEILDGLNENLLHIEPK